MRFIDRFPMVSKRMGLQVDIAQSSLPEDVYKMRVTTPDFAQDKAIPVLPFLASFQSFELNGKAMTRVNDLMRLGRRRATTIIEGPFRVKTGSLQVRTNDLIRIKD